MSLIDSHCHLNLLDLSQYVLDLDGIVEAARQVGVIHMLCVGTNMSTSRMAITLAKRYADVSASVGIHPSDTVLSPLPINELLPLAQDAAVMAIGETGLDYYYNDKNLDQMRSAFAAHIQLARRVNKPLIIHTRNARRDTIDIMKNEGAASVRGVMHCFTESWEMAKEALDLGFFISFSGIITFKNAQSVVDVAARVPLDRLLIETDCPFLAPVPYRGKPNQPQFVRFVAEKVASLKKMPLAEIEAQTTANAIELFKLQ